MGLKYFCEYRTLNTNELWRIEIDIPDYSGSPIEKIGVGGSTCIIEHSGADALLEKFLIPSSATVTLLFDDDAQVRELQQLKDKTALLRVYRSGGSQIYWKGYVIADGIQHPDSGVMTPITIKAVDMVEASNDMPFVNSVTGFISIGGVAGAVNSPINWIRKCLIANENIANPLPIRWSCSLKNGQYPTDDFFGGRTGFIPNYDVFKSSREKTTVQWMMENIIKSAGCVMFQYGGFWYIVSITDLAQSGTLSFYQIDGNDLGDKTATTVSLSLSKALPKKLNESTYTMSQKPISKVKSTYNHSMPANIIPNGSFDILDVDGKPLYWSGDSGSVVVSASNPINSRNAGKAMRVKNNSLIGIGTVTYRLGGVDGLPYDADVLFKDMQWGFTFMPVSSFATEPDGTINWDSNPLSVRMLYTVYDNVGNIATLHLNEFGYWQNSAQLDAFKITAVESPTATTKRVTFSGSSYAGQIYTRQWGNNAFSLVFDGQRTLSQTLSWISLNDPMGPTVSGNGLVYSVGIGVPVFTVNVTEYNTFTASFIPFKVEGLKLNDIATIQFQSKGNQGRVLMPFPGNLDVEGNHIVAGKLSLELILKQGQEIVYDDVYMNVSDNKEYWEITDNGNDGLAEYELEISSSFSGFMTSSYMNGFSTSNLSMYMDNGTDRGTLTELFGKTALRMLSNPTEKIDTEVEGEFGMLNLISYRSKQYLPLKSTVNTETNSTNLTIAELVYDDELELESTHKSTGDAEGNSGFSSGGYGGGGGNAGDNLFLTDLKDVAIGTPQQGDLLMYDSATGKWVNSDNYYNKTQSDARFHPLENQRLSTGNNVVFNGVRGTDYVAIPSTATSATGIGFTIWVDENGTGGGATPPPVVVNLTDLADVNITALTDDQVLMYDAGSGKWVNGTVGGGGVIDAYTKAESDARFYPLNSNPAGYLTNISLAPYALKEGSNATGVWPIGITGNAGSVTNGVYTSGSYANPAWITSLAYSKLTGVPAPETPSFQNVTGVGSTTNNIVYFTGANTATSPTSGVAVNIRNNGIDSYDHTNAIGSNLTLNQSGGNVGVGITNPTAKLDVNGLGKFIGLKPTDFLIVPSAMSTNPLAIGYQLYVDENGSGGGSTPPPVIVNLTDLQDVSIGSPTNGQVLTYNSTTGKWVNGNAGSIIDAYTKTEINNFFSGTVAITGYNKINWDTAFGWGNHAGLYPTYNGTGALGTWNISITGNAGSVTNGVYTNGSYANPNFITSLAYSKITGVPTPSIPNLNQVLTEGATSTLGANFGGGVSVGFGSAGFTDAVLSLKSNSTMPYPLSITNRNATANGRWNLYVDAAAIDDEKLAIVNSLTGNGIFIQPNGNVAIGKTIADTKLDVNGSIRALPDAGTSNAVTVNSQLSVYALASSVPTNNNQLTNGAGYITEARLAIGQTIGARALGTTLNDILNANNTTLLGAIFGSEMVFNRSSTTADGNSILINNNTGGASGIQYKNININSGYNWQTFITNDSTPKFKIGQSNLADYLTILSSSGYTGIGTSNPTEKLQVAGNTLTQGLKATAKLETRGVNSGGTASGNFYDLYIQE